jgi:hypothetical protein
MAKNDKIKVDEKEQKVMGVQVAKSNGSISSYFRSRGQERPLGGDEMAPN